jgi:16S rRNA (cytidine1402-2'-O)-methyltransferase
MPGRLIVVPTPIGNLGDITARALASLQEADVVYAEDTRRSRALLQHFGIRKPLRSLFVGNEKEKSMLALGDLEVGRTVALVSDAGTPGVSDPGAFLIQAAIAGGVRVEVLPGPQAILPALLLSGLPPAPFTFVGFLPRAPQARRAALAELTRTPWTLVFYEAPHRLGRTLADMLDILGERPAAVVREISKLHEESRRGTLAELARWAQAEEVRGEVAVVVGGGAVLAVTRPDLPLADFVARQLSLGETPAAIARAARDQGYPRREAYQEALRQVGKSGED